MTEKLRSQRVKHFIQFLLIVEVEINFGIVFKFLER